MLRVWPSEFESSLLAPVSVTRRPACAQTPVIRKHTSNVSRADPCSVDFGRETPKFRFEFCCGFLGGFFPSDFFTKERPPKKIHRKIHCKIHPEICANKFPSDFCRSLFLTMSEGGHRARRVSAGRGLGTFFSGAEIPPRR